MKGNRLQSEFGRKPPQFVESKSCLTIIMHLGDKLADPGCLTMRDPVKLRVLVQLECRAPRALSNHFQHGPCLRKACFFPAMVSQALSNIR
jgi:hypothetical protein